MKKAPATHVTKHTRAGNHGKVIQCPHCKDTVYIYHFSWSALVCRECKAEVAKTDWLIANKPAR